MALLRNALACVWFMLAVTGVNAAEKIVIRMSAQAIDVGGYRVQFKPGDRSGSRFVEMTILTADGRFRR